MWRKSGHVIPQRYERKEPVLKERLPVLPNGGKPHASLPKSQSDPEKSKRFTTDDFDSLVQALKDIKVENDKFKREVKRQSILIKELENSNKYYRLYLDPANAQYMKERQQIRPVKDDEKLAVITGPYCDYTDDDKNLLARNDDRQKENLALRNQLNVLDSYVRTVEEDNESLRDNNRELDFQVLELVNKLERSSEDNEYLKRDHENETIEFRREYQELNERFRKDYQELNEQFRRDYQELNEINGTLKQRLYEMSLDMDKKERQIKSLQKEEKLPDARESYEKQLAQSDYEM